MANGGAPTGAVLPLVVHRRPPLTRLPCRLRVGERLGLVQVSAGMSHRGAVGPTSFVPGRAGPLRLCGQAASSG